MIKKLFSTLFVTTLFFCSSLASTHTITKTVNDLVQENSWTVSSGNDIGTLATSFYLNDTILVSTSGEANCGSIWGTETNDWRIYHSKNGDISLEAKYGIIKSVKLTFNVSKNGCLKLDNTTINSNDTVEINNTNVTFVVLNTDDKSNGQVRVTCFEVIYELKDGPETNISNIEINQTLNKYFDGKQIVIYKDNKKYNLIGQEVQ